MSTKCVDKSIDFHTNQDNTLNLIKRCIVSGKWHSVDDLTFSALSHIWIKLTVNSGCCATARFLLTTVRTTILIATITYSQLHLVVFLARFGYKYSLTSPTFRFCVVRLRHAWYCDFQPSVELFELNKFGVKMLVRHNYNAQAHTHPPAHFNSFQFIKRKWVPLFDGKLQSVLHSVINSAAA